MSSSHSRFYDLDVGERSHTIKSTFGLSEVKHVLAAQTTIRSGLPLE